MSFFHCISGFSGTSYENLQDIATTRSFISCCFYWLLHQPNCFSQIFRTSFNIWLYIKRKIFITTFSFLTDSLNTDQIENVVLSSAVKMDRYVYVYTIFA